MATKTASRPESRSKTGLRWGEGEIVARGERFYARWYEHAPDGRVRRRGRTFKDRDAAENHLRDVHRAKRDGSYVSPSEITVAELVADWLTRGESRWKAVTVATYRQRAKTHVAPALGAMRVETLTTPRIQHWIDRMVKAGLDASTVDGASRVLSGALREAAQIGIIPRNPAVGIRRPSIRLKEAHTWSGAEVGRVIGALRDEPMWQALYRLALTTGMRPGEIRALKWADINLETGAVTVRRTITKDVDGHVIVGTTTKTGRARAVALPTSALKALTVWRIAQKKRQLAAEAWVKDDMVFDRGDGSFLPLTTWQKRHARVCDAAGVTLITLHQIRHTTATLELEAGTHPLIVSQRLGHVSITTTLDMYSHLSTALQTSAAEALDRRLFGDVDDADHATTTTSH